MRAIVEDSTFTIETILTPFFFASSIASRVSAVSPLWEIAIMSDLSVMKGRNEPNSEPNMKFKCFCAMWEKRYVPTIPTFPAVPQPIM
ncbi:MAG: hypothetical protein ACD_65C00022G0001 [uncultured bacterium]|nr:MAG: hypothetical protein ACD_65C00022G0001 [uncultured bacterium]